MITTRRTLRSFVTAGVGFSVALLSAIPMIPGARAATSYDALQVSNSQDLGPGVNLSKFSIDLGTRTVTGDLVTANLADPKVRIGLLHPAAVGARAQVSTMTATQHAVAGVNGDFFNIDESQHPGVEATGSSDGPEIVAGHALKAAVPDAQRFGPAMAPGTSTRDVIGVGNDGKARIGSLRLTGTVWMGRHSFPLRGLNQYALPENGVGAFTSAWGDVSRMRAVCGSDTQRAAPCSTDTAEVTVREGRVSAVSQTVGAGRIGRDETVLVGREDGADMLRKLHVGQRVHLRDRLVADGVPFRVAVGGAPILRNGAVLPGVDGTVAATRTAAGVSSDGRKLFLVALDGSAEAGGGLTLQQLAGVLVQFGAANGINLDGGGSTTCAVRLPGSDQVQVISKRAPGVPERAVANGLGVWTS